MFLFSAILFHVKSTHFRKFFDSSRRAGSADSYLEYFYVIQHPPTWCKIAKKLNFNFLSEQLS